MHTDRNSFRERVALAISAHDGKKQKGSARAFPRLRSLNTMSIKNGRRQMKIFQAKVNMDNGCGFVDVYRCSNAMRMQHG